MYVSIYGTIFEVSAGDIVLINAGAAHSNFNSHSGTVCRGFQFDITFFDENFIEWRDAIFQNPVLGKSTKKDAVCAHLRQRLQEIFCENTEKKTGYQLAIKSKLCEIMLTILREMPRRCSRESSSKVNQILAPVLRNVDDPEFTLEKAADALNLNKFYFSHLFKRYTGQSFHSYLVKTRITFAKHYLIESKMSVTDIAFYSGFNSIPTFNRTFKLLTGFTPREYRKENSNPVNGFRTNFSEKMKKNAKIDKF
jgi:AraC-like DNA-binding protein